MKKSLALLCVLFLLLTAVSVPSAFAMGMDYSGEWVCMYVDFGDGELLTEFQGANLQEAMTIQLNADGTFLLDSFGEQQAGTWQPTGAGIAMIAEGIVVPFSYEDDMLVNTDEGLTMYFGRPTETPQQGGLGSLINLSNQAADTSFSFSGAWNAISYEVSEVSYDIAMFFPDGLTMTLNEDGSGSAMITEDYTESITWEETEDGIAINGSYVLSDPVWDAENNTLSIAYSSDIVRIIFEKAEGDTPAAPAADTSKLPQAYTCEYFSAAFPEEWAQDEYNTYEWSDSYSAQYNLEDEDDWTICSVQISVGIEEAAAYRSDINELLDYAADAGQDTLDETSIGGHDFRGITYGDYWVYTKYLARVPEASVTIRITITDPENAADILPDILSSIVFTYPIPETPLEDPPMPEDGVAYQPSPASVTVDSYTIEASWLMTGGSVIPKDEYSNAIAVAGDMVYVLSSDTLYPLTRNGTALTAADEPIDLGDDFARLSAVTDGTLYITDGFYTALSYQDSALNEFDMDGYLAMHPDGQWGLCYWSSYNVKKITFTADGIATKDWILTDLSDDDSRQGRFDSISYIQITSDSIFVAGSDATTEYATRIVMYDFDGNEVAVFGSDDWTDDSAIGSVTGIVQTGNGIIVQGGSYDEYKFYALDGSYIGAIDYDDLLGTDSPWTAAMTATEDGAMVLVAQERDDESAVELLVFELTGF